MLKKYENTDAAEVISLTAGSSNKIYHILLSDGSLLTTDPDYSYGKRAAFVLNNRQKDAKIVKAFLGTADPKKGTIVVDVNIDSNIMFLLHSFFDFP